MRGPVRGLNDGGGLWFPVKNMESVTMPAFACIGLDPVSSEFTSVLDARRAYLAWQWDKSREEQYLKGYRPRQIHVDNHSAACLAFNGPQPILPGQFGSATLSYPARVLSIGRVFNCQAVGPQSGEWHVVPTEGCLDTISHDHSIRVSDSSAHVVIWVRPANKFGVGGYVQTQEVPTYPILPPPGDPMLDSIGGYGASIGDDLLTLRNDAFERQFGDFVADRIQPISGGSEVRLCVLRRGVYHGCISLTAWSYPTPLDGGSATYRLYVVDGPIKNPSNPLNEQSTKFWGHRQYRRDTWYSYNSVDDLGLPSTNYGSWNRENIAMPFMVELEARQGLAIRVMSQDFCYSYLCFTLSLLTPTRWFSQLSSGLVWDAANNLGIGQ